VQTVILLLQTPTAQIKPKQITALLPNFQTEHISRVPILLRSTYAISWPTSTQIALLHTSSLNPTEILFQTNNKDIPIGVRDFATRLWTINLGSGRSIPVQPSTTPFAPEYVINNAYTQISLPQLVKHLHKVTFSLFHPLD